MSTFGPVIVRQAVPASTQEVWQQLVGDETRAWWPGLSLVAEQGGTISDQRPGVDGTESLVQGTIDVFVAGLTLGCTWRAPEDATDTTTVIMVRPHDDNLDHTQVTVIESGFAVFADAEARVAAVTGHWQETLGGLAGEFGGGAEASEADGDGDETDSGDVAVDADNAESVEVSLDEASPDETTAAEVTVEPDDAGTETAPDAAITDDEADELAVEPEVEEDAEVALERDSSEPVLVFDDHDDEEVIDGEVMDDAPIHLPEMSGITPSIDTTVQITGDLRPESMVEVEELSEWELLLRGETEDPS